MNSSSEFEREPILSELKTEINTALEGTKYRVENCALYVLADKRFLPLSNFLIVPTEFIKKDNGNGMEVLVRAYGLSNNGILPEITLPLKAFESMNWVVSEWGFGAHIKPVHNAAKNLAAATQYIGHKTAQNITIYIHNGWRKNGNEWVYLHNRGVVGTGNIRVELEGQLSEYAFDDCGEDYHEAVVVSYSLRDAAPRNVMIPLLALTYLSPLNEFLRRAGHEPAFIKMLTGKTGTMKSTLAAVLLNHFGTSFTAKSLPGSFKDTANALEAKGFAVKDALFIIDDYFPSTRLGEHDKMTTILQSLIRSYGDRAGRGRLTSDAKLKNAYIPRGNLLITGEDTPRVEESSLARLFFLEVEPGQIDMEQISTLQKNPSLLNQAMRGFIEWILPQADTLPDTLSKKFNVYRQKAQSDGRHQRIAESIAWLFLGYDMFVEYAVSKGVVPEKDRQGELDDAWDILCELGECQNKRLTVDSPPTMFLSALNELLTTEKCYCVMMNNNAISPIGRTKGNGFIGYEDSQYYYLHPDTTMIYLQDFYRRQGIQFSITKHTLFKLLATENLITFSVNSGRVTHTVVKNIGGRNERLLWLKKSALE